MEFEAIINKLFHYLENNIPNTINTKIKPIWEINTINKESTLGEQIKYYRRLANIKQSELGLKLGYSRDAIIHIENNDLKLIDIKLLIAILEELNIKNKININDDYILFLLNNPCEHIIEIRQKLQLSRKDLANLLNVSLTSIRRWENGNCHISRSKYDKLKKV